MGVTRRTGDGHDGGTGLASCDLVLPSLFLSSLLHLLEIICDGQEGRLNHHMAGQSLQIRLLPCVVLGRVLQNVYM